MLIEYQISINIFNNSKCNIAELTQYYFVMQHHRSTKILDQLRACCLLSAKPQLEPMLAYCQLYPQEHSPLKLLSKYRWPFFQHQAFEKLICKMLALFTVWRKRELVFIFHIIPWCWVPFVQYTQLLTNWSLTKITNILQRFLTAFSGVKNHNILFHISLKFGPRSQIDDGSSLIQVMA